jgi:hypothetical protein
VTGSCEQGNAPLGSIYYSEFFDWVSNYKLMKEDCGPDLNLASGFCLRKSMARSSGTVIAAALQEGRGGDPL